MKKNGSVQIQADAVRALAEWKAIFSEHVSVKARELALKSSSPQVVTLDHYRKAACLALEALAAAVQDTKTRDGSQEAA